MKLPKTFMPEKNLEDKTDHLLNTEPPKHEGYKIDGEAEKLFPEFINYLKKHYKVFTIRKIQEVPERSWRITIPKEDPKPFDDVEIIGGITSYRNKHSGAVECGYEGGVEIKYAYIGINYRECYKYFDKDNRKCVKRMLPLRRDNNKDVPFP